MRWGKVRRTETKLNVSSRRTLVDRNYEWVRDYAMLLEQVQMVIAMYGHLPIFAFAFTYIRVRFLTVDGSKHMSTETEFR